jgi:hypothetical protein
LEKTSVKEASNRAKIAQLQQELDASTMVVNSLNKQVSDRGLEYETRKAQDFQQILYEMLYSEVEYHAKGKLNYRRNKTNSLALEILTQVTSDICSGDLNEDLEKIQSAYKTS